MFRKQFIEVLNRHAWLQYIFFILPIIMVTIYGSAYLTDMLNISRSLTVNDNISARAWAEDMLHVVSYTEPDADGKVFSVVEGVDHDDVTVKTDDVLFYVQLFDTGWYQIISANQKSLMSERCDLFEIVDFDDEHVTVAHDDIELTFEYGDVICGVFLSEDGLWRVKFNVDEMPYYDLEALHMVEVLGINDGVYTVRVSASYLIETQGVDINFCSSLPTDDLYYNESTRSFVRNVSSDYPWTFMLRSNIAVVLLSSIFFCVLIYKIQDEKKLVMSDNKYIFGVNVFAVCLLLLCVPFTLIML